MAIDPRISLGIQQPEPFDPVEEYGRALSIAELIQNRGVQRQVAQANIEQTRLENERIARQEQAERERQAKLQRIFTESGGDEEKIVTGLKSFDPKMGLEFEKAIGEVKAQRQTAAEKAFKQQQEKLEIFGNALGVIDNTPDDLKPAVYSGIVSDFQKRGFFPEGFEVPAQFDQQWVAAKRAEWMDAKAQMEAAAAKRKADLDAMMLPSQKAKAAADLAVSNATLADPKLLTPAQRLTADNQAEMQKFAKQRADAALVRARAAQAGASGANSKTVAAESTLRDDYARDSKEFRDVAMGWDRVQAAGFKGKESTGVNDIALIFGYMKMLDPGSVVREGEYANAQNSGGVPDRVRAMYNGLLTGDKLAPEVRQRMRDQAQELYTSAKRQHDTLATQFRDIAKRSGVNPDNVVLDYSAKGDSAKTVPASSIDWSKVKKVTEVK